MHSLDHKSWLTGFLAGEMETIIKLLGYHGLGEDAKQVVATYAMTELYPEIVRTRQEHALSDGAYPPERH